MVIKGRTNLREHKQKPLKNLILNKLLLDCEVAYKVEYDMLSSISPTVRNGKDDRRLFDG